MSNTVSPTSSATSVESTSSVSVGNLYKFYSRAHWSNGRHLRYQMVDTDAVQTFAGYDDECRDVFTFDDLTSPLINEAVTLVWFKDWTPSTSKEIAKSNDEKDKIVAQKKAKVVKVSIVFPIAVTAIISAILQITGKPWFEITAFSLPFIFLFTIFVACFILDRESSRVESVRWKELTEAQPNVGSDDELYVFGVSSIIPELAVHSNEAAILVRNKLRLNPDVDTLDEWVKMVKEFFTLQKNYPADLIPLDNEDTCAALESLNAKVSELKAELLKAKAIEGVSAAHGRAVSGEEAVDKETSTAALAGSLALIKTMSIADVE